MRSGPLRPSLYRNWRRAATAVMLLAASLSPAQAPVVQYGRKAAVDKGPRALGLVQLSPKGDKGRLIPIAIMMDGKFYDAGSYKAAPVPMALDFDTVYEGFRSGVSQGLFTITQPGQLNHTWLAEGSWLPAGMKAPEKSKKYETPVIEDRDAPPVLHRPSDRKDDGKDKNEGQSKADGKNKDRDKGTVGPSTEKPKASAPVAEDAPIADPHRPRLRRGKPDASAHREPFANFDEIPEAKAGKDSGSAPPIVMIPAISDAAGPDPRPYIYEMKAEEEAGYKKKMLELASSLLRGTAAVRKESAPARKKTGTAKDTGPALEQVRLTVYDLSSSNEPVLVLSAKTHPEETNSEKIVAGKIEEPQEITLIARTNLEGELKKLFFAQTDARHLDVSPRLELVDAVDADGDGRGELLFRRTFDNGSTYAIYRVTADRLWPLFEVTP